MTDETVKQSDDDARSGGRVVHQDVYFDDLDTLGMLHNSRYGALVERAWVNVWRAHGVGISKDWRLLDDGKNVLREFAITYEFPIMRPGPYSVQIWIDKVGRTSLKHGFRIYSPDEATTHAHGHRVLINIDTQTGRPTPWSDKVEPVAALLRRSDTPARGDVL